MTNQAAHQRAQAWTEHGGRRWRAGVAGLRRGMSFVRLLAALPDVEVIAVADPDPAARTAASSGFAKSSTRPPAMYTSLIELLDVPGGLDFVVLATPGPEHVTGAELALGRGVHVLSEVPAVWSREECERLVAAVEQSAAQYMLAENFCYSAWVDAVQQMHRQGAFGTIFSVEAEYIHDHADPSVSGFRDREGKPTWRAHMEPIRYLTHDLGPLMWITGHYPTEVICLGTTGNFDPEIIDLQTALVRLTGGGLARITCSFANAHWTWHRCTLYGTRASLDTGWIGRDQPRYWTRDIPHLQEPMLLPLGADVPGAPAVARQGGRTTAEYYMVRAFLRALEEGSQPPIDVYDAIMYSLPGICAVESAAAGGQPVSVPQYQLRRPTMGTEAKRHDTFDRD
jgi:predicted dehydrogenase